MGDIAALVRLLRIAGALALALALISLALPAAAPVTAGVLVGLLVMLPLARVALLALSWARRGDRRFALAALALLVIVAIGPLGALLQRGG